MHDTDIKKLSLYFSNKFPKVSLVVSNSNNDKDDCINFISSNLNLDIERITDADKDYLLEIYTRSTDYIYVIELNGLTINKQNTILKFIEEPPINSYIVLLTDMLDNVIDTVLTRSVVIELHRYTKDELKKYIVDKNIDKDVNLLLEISTTLDDISAFSKYDLDKLNTLSETIISLLSVATLSNTLTIPSKYILNGTYSVEVFIKMLQFNLYKTYLNSSNKIYYSMYLDTVEFCKSLRVKGASIEILLNKLLTSLWLVNRGC